MSWLNKLILFFIGFQLYGCHSSKSETVKVNTAVVRTIFPQKEKILIISCIKCSCFLPALNYAYKQDSSYFKTISVFADTSCNKWSFSVNHISQKLIDSIGDDMYNIILLKSNEDDYIARVIDSKESPRLLESIKFFFD